MTRYSVLVLLVWPSLVFAEVWRCETKDNAREVYTNRPTVTAVQHCSQARLDHAPMTRIEAKKFEGLLYLPEQMPLRPSDMLPDTENTSAWSVRHSNPGSDEEKLFVDK